MAVELIPLQCCKCQWPIPAKPDEGAWVCGQCGQGLLLDEEVGTVPLDIHFSVDAKPGQPGRPFWVTQGTVQLNRTVYGGGDQTGTARQFWSVPRPFFIAAYTCNLDDLLRTSTQLLTEPPQLRDGPPVPFAPVTLFPEDVFAYAEFTVVNLEASRRDNLRQVDYQLKIDPPVLWIV